MDRARQRWRTRRVNQYTLFTRRPYGMRRNSCTPHGTCPNGQMHQYLYGSTRPFLSFPQPVFRLVLSFAQPIFRLVLSFAQPIFRLATVTNGCGSPAHAAMPSFDQAFDQVLPRPAPGSLQGEQPALRWVARLHLARWWSCV